MPFFGFSRTSTSRHKNKKPTLVKKTSVDVTAARSTAVKEQHKEPIRRTSSCTVTRLHVEKFDHSVVGLTSDKLVDLSLEEPHIKIQHTLPSPVSIKRAKTLGTTLLKPKQDLSPISSNPPKKPDTKSRTSSTIETTDEHHTPKASNALENTNTPLESSSDTKQDDIPLEETNTNKFHSSCDNNSSSDKSGFESDSDKIPDVVLRRKITTNRRSPRSRRRSNRKDSILVKLNRRSQHFEDNPIDVSKNRKSRNFEEDIQQCQKVNFLIFIILFYFFFLRNFVLCSCNHVMGYNVLIHA